MNSTDTALGIFNRESHLARFLLTGFTYFYTFVSLVGNTILIIAIKKNVGGEMNTTNNYLILNLSVVDLARSVLSLIIVSGKLALNEDLLGMEWNIQGIAGHATCKVYVFSLRTLYIAPILLILVISIDRACAILFPMKFLITKSVARCLVSLAWLLSCVFASHAFYFYQILDFRGQPNCIFESSDETALAQYQLYYLIHTIFIATTFFGIITLYGAIAVKLWFRSIPGNQNTEAQKRRRKMNRKVLAMLVVLVLTFCVSHLPLWIYEMSFQVETFSKLHSLLTNDPLYLLIAVVFINSYGAVNPCIIIAFIPSFRAAIKVQLRKVLPCISP